MFCLFSFISLPGVIVLFPPTKEDKKVLSPFKIFFCDDA